MLQRVLFATSLLAAAANAQQLWFEENRGQLQEEIQLVGRGAGVLAVVTARSLFLRPADGRSGAVEISVDGASECASACGDDRLPGQLNSFVGRDPRRWARGLPMWGRARIEETLPGVTLVIRQHATGALEFDLELAAGVCADDVRLRVSGVTELTIAPGGELLATTTGASLRLGAADVQQEGQLLECSYVLKHCGADWLIGFEVQGRDLAQPVVIDPVVTYATYLGGVNLEDGQGVALSPGGDMVVVGETSSPDYPLLNPWSSMSAGPPYDAFVTRIDAAGSIVWSTLWGGDFADYPDAVCFAPNGDVIVCGHSQSAGVPELNNWQTGPGGGGVDGFVFRLTGDGQTLLYSSFLGGGSSEVCAAVACDNSGAAYVTGNTQSGNFPTTPLAFQTSTGGGTTDAFVTKIPPTGGSLEYSTYLGGASDDSSPGIVVDSAGRALLTGYTSSANFPTASPIQASAGGASGNDSFVTKVAPDGRSLVWSTYLGGSADDYGIDVALDGSERVYIGGFTNSPNFPTVSPLQGAGAGSFDALISRISADGLTLERSTYLGGASNDQGRGIGVDGAGNVWLGAVADGGFPQVGALFSYGGGQDFVMAQLDADLSQLRFCTYWGGSNTDYMRGLAVNDSGAVVAAGQTMSLNLPTVNPLQSMYAGGTFDVAILRLEGGGCVLCGDCNSDGSVSILDALTAAQHSSALILLTGDAFTCCNVIGLLEPDPSAVVNILDALTIAQESAGLPVTLICL